MVWATFVISIFHCPLLVDNSIFVSFFQPPPHAGSSGKWFEVKHNRLDLARFVSFPDDSSMAVHAVTKPTDWLRNLNQGLGKLLLDIDGLTFSAQVSEMSGEKTIRMADGRGTRLDFEIIPHKYKRMGPNEDLEVDR